jgi:flagella synthesis protein FlgN
MTGSVMHELLAQTVAELTRFVQLLSDEQTALVSAQTDQLPKLTEQKSALATRLAELEAQRAALLDAEGFPTDRQALEAWFRKEGERPAGSALQDQRTITQTAEATASYAQTLNSQALLFQFFALAAQAKEKNELNGQLINAHLQQNKQALNALLGASADVSTYSEDGQQKSSVGKRPLGSA